MLVMFFFIVSIVVIFALGFVVAKPQTDRADAIVQELRDVLNE